MISCIFVLNCILILLHLCNFLTYSVSSVFVTFWICGMKIQYNTIQYNACQKCRTNFWFVCYINIWRTHNLIFLNWQGKKGAIVLWMPYRCIWGVDVYLLSCITLALDGCEWSVSCTGCFTPWQRTLVPTELEACEPHSQFGNFGDERNLLLLMADEFYCKLAILWIIRWYNIFISLYCKKGKFIMDCYWEL
jgi:hypothetical protein